MRIPIWLNPAHASDQSLVDLLTEHQAEVHDLRDTEISIDDFLGSKYGADLKFGAFKATKDSVLYSRLISKVLTFAEPGSTLVDLGTGSALPLIAALGNDSSSIRVIAVEPDPNSCRLARENIRHVGFDEVIEVQAETMESVLSKIKSLKSPLVVVSNPPYLPWPIGLPSISQVDGGLLGTKYLEMILEGDYPPQTMLALQWSSLTCPLRTLKAIRHRYQVAALTAHEVRFGQYTSAPLVKSYLRSLRARGEVSFNDEAEDCSQVIFGAVLRPSHW